MTGTLEHLFLATAAFVASHFLLSWRPLRSRVIGVVGDRVFTLAYSALAIAILYWMVAAYSAAPQRVLWGEIGGARIALLILMLPATVLLAGGFSLASPTVMDFPGLGYAKATDGEGVFAITRHPVMWAVAIWSGGHMLVNGDAASVVLFGGMTILALGGMLHIDARRRATGGDGWRRFEARTSVVPFVALIEGRADWASLRFASWRLALGLVLYVLFLVLHKPVIGPSPLPV